MKKTSIILIGLIILVLIFLGILTIKTNNIKKPYRELEKQIVNSMKIYYGQDTNLKKLPKKGNTHKVTLNELKKFGLNINNTINKDICDGYGIVKGLDVSHNYKAYIKCNNYITKNYEK